MTSEALPEIRRATGSASGTARVRDWYNAFVARHEVAWELTMAVLAVVYVVVGFAGDDANGDMAVRLGVVEAAITVVFVLEFASRFAASWDRVGYLRGHWIDLVALVPTVREIRILRLLRFLRLVRAAVLSLIHI